MGLYLAVFDGDQEIDGVEVGPYADFNSLRDYIVRTVEEGQPGAKFPTLIVHSDSDGEWSVIDCERLEAELEDIITVLKTHVAVPFVSEWQASVAKSKGLNPKNAYESFIDVDGEFILGRLKYLTSVALKHQLPISFQ